MGNPGKIILTDSGQALTESLQAGIIKKVLAKDDLELALEPLATGGRTALYGAILVPAFTALP